MSRGIKGSVLLSSVDAFMATAAYESYTVAGSMLQTSATTVMRQVRTLELWLHRTLIYQDELFTTEDGAKFVETASEIIALMDESSGLRRELSKTRVHPDGVVTIEGVPIDTPSAKKIGAYMVRSRSDLSLATPAPPKTSANDPLILAFLDDWLEAKQRGDPPADERARRGKREADR